MTDPNMNLYERNAFNFYIEGARKASGYHVVPCDVSEIADGLEDIYSYSYIGPGFQRVTVAIGKVYKS